MLPSAVQDKLDALPPRPGVYLFKGHAAAGSLAPVLYVGKASNLRSRVRSYFAASSSDSRFFIPFLGREVADLETYVVGNEKEAALLENELIKQHQPRYNVKLRDDKDFLSLRIDPSAPWPRLSVVRRPRADGARYYGPYDSASGARQTLRQINRFFRLRTCKDSDFRSRVRPCLQHQIKRCPAPCVKEVDRVEYGAQVDLVGLFLDGRHDELVEDLERRMAAAADALDYERAALFRDQLRAVSRVRANQRVASVRDLDQDVVGLHRRGDQAEVALLTLRSGRLSGVRTFSFRGVRIPDDAVLSDFVSAYYRQGPTLPDELLLPVEVEVREGLSAWLSDLRGRRVKVLVPQRGHKRQLLHMAAENAEHAYQEKARAKEDLEARLGALQSRLRLPALPRRIECVDISHTGGADTVGAIARMSDGVLDPKGMRTFRVKRVSGGDDYGAMYEVLSRRFRRGRADEAGWRLPDLMVVDGGRGQLGVALAALKDLGVSGVPVVGLAKERDGGAHGVVERVYLPGQKNPIPLPDRSPSREFLCRVRDEAHRVSNAQRVKLGKRRRLRSGLDDIPGVGPKTRVRLLKHFGALKDIRAASAEALVAAGATRAQAKAIQQRFAGGQPAPAVSEADAERAALDNAFSDSASPNDVGPEEISPDEIGPEEINPDDVRLARLANDGVPGG